ncbi:MAG: N-acetyl-gamma-glutamyl-phosphate reductase [Neisseriaceae bacterium]|nr:N-acetyl-gamma-glutamyl-phosphate reductase [Neisseriaceae bacterium]
MNQMIKIGIVGATGYTGVELLRILSNHPNANIAVVTSRGDAGTKLCDMFPSLRGVYPDLLFTHPDEAKLDECDLVFFATPNGIAMTQTVELLNKGVKVIDLSADFRIRDIATWEEWYKMTHACPDTVKQAVYGLPEMNRDKIAKAQLIANPGCYPTCVTLALLPLLRAGCLKANAPIIADCKSGVSGAGRKGAVANLLCEAGDNFKAYGAAGHRHLPEIKQNIGDIASGFADNFIFVPHLTPLIRGMHATIYVQAENAANLHETLLEFYSGSLFVDVLPCGVLPETRSVRASNFCRIGVVKAPQTDNAYILFSVIDNLVKGAAGQAVQNMNIMFSLPENEGLKITPVLP